MGLRCGSKEGALSCSSGGVGERDVVPSPEMGSLRRLLVSGRVGVMIVTPNDQRWSDLMECWLMFLMMMLLLGGFSFCLEVWVNRYLDSSCVLDLGQ